MGPSDGLVATRSGSRMSLQGPEPPFGRSHRTSEISLKRHSQSWGGALQMVMLSTRFSDRRSTRA